MNNTQTFIQSLPLYRFEHYLSNASNDMSFGHTCQKLWPKSPNNAKRTFWKLCVDTYTLWVDTYKKELPMCRYIRVTGRLMYFIFKACSFCLMYQLHVSTHDLCRLTCDLYRLAHNRTSRHMTFIGQNILFSC